MAAPALLPRFWVVADRLHTGDRGADIRRVRASVGRSVVQTWQA